MGDGNFKKHCSTLTISDISVKPGGTMDLDIVHGRKTYSLGAKNSPYSMHDTIQHSLTCLQTNKSFQYLIKSNLACNANFSRLGTILINLCLQRYLNLKVFSIYSE